jgi:hypothetical protein
VRRGDQGVETYGTYGSALRPTGCPWSRLDGGLMPPGPQVQGRSALHVKDGWTALSFPDRSIDNRGGSHSTFLFEAELDFDEALRYAKQLFPSVFARYTFEIARAEA